MKALNKDLPDRINEWLRVEELGEVVKVVPCKYLGEDWQQVADKYDGLGGRWVSAGKESHWVFNKLAESNQTQQTTPPIHKPVVGKLTQTQLVEEGVAMIERHTAEIQGWLKRWKEAGFKSV